ncbi:MAG: stress-induced morphogen [Alphaproteobacteria bacterium]|jgi:stress-induced morphogen
MLTIPEIQTMIENAFPKADVKILDPMNDGVHLGALIISDDFEGKNRLARHRMVYSALGDAFSGPLHALQITTMTVSENSQKS